METSVATAGVWEFGENFGERERGHESLQNIGDNGPTYPKLNSLPTPNIERPWEAHRKFSGYLDTRISFRYTPASRRRSLPMRGDAGTEYRER
jgi:hypothetical protein